MNSLYVNAKNQFRTNQNVKVLQQGSSVLVRVIADKGNGRYEGSVAGVRVNLQAKNSLKAGQTFTARVNLNNGRIEIVPEGDKKINIFSDAVLIEEGGENQLQKVLTEIGLPANQLNSHIAMQMKQLGMKLDPEIIRKLHAMSLRFPGKEKKASELLTILKNKNLELSESQVLNLLNLLEGEEDYDDKEKKGELKIINQKKGWIFLPYEIVSCQEKEKIGRGIIRLLIGDDRKLKKLNFNILIAQKEYVFNLDFENKRCSKVSCNFPVKDSEKEKTLEILKKRLSGAGGPEVIFAEKSELEGSACSMDDFFTVGGRV